LIYYIIFILYFQSIDRMEQGFLKVGQKGGKKDLSRLCFCVAHKHIERGRSTWSLTQYE
jgi:hypothetical protein